MTSILLCADGDTENSTRDSATADWHIDERCR